MQDYSPSFMLAWEAARYNAWYDITIALMYVVGPVLGLSLAWGRRQLGVHKKIGCALLVLVSLGLFTATLESGVQSIFMKWQLRTLAAGRGPELEFVGSMDTANLVFAPIIAGFQGGVAVLLCLGVFQVGKFVFRMQARPREKNMAHTQDHIMTDHASDTSDS